MEKSEPKLGDIHWLLIDEGISHPHIITRINEDSTYTVCALTTNMKKLNMPGNIILDIGEGNLEKQSIVEVYKELTVKKDNLGKYIGSLSTERVDQILNGMEFIKRSFLDPRK